MVGLRDNKTLISLCGLLLAVMAITTGCEEFFDAGGQDDNDDNTTETTTVPSNDDNDNAIDPGTEGWEWVESPAASAHINDIFFVDDERGWLATDGDPLLAERGIWYTDNGGDHWDWRREDFNAYSVFEDSVDGRTWMGGSDQRELWFSDDGHDFQPNDEGLQQQDWIGSMYFWDADTGLLGSQTGERIHRTTDGGENFEQLEFSSDVTGINKIEALGDEVWASTGPSFTQDNTGGLVLYSDDRGQTWERIEFEDNAHHYEGGTIEGIHIISSDEIWVSGVNRQLYYTDDGMETWNQIDGIPNEISGFNDIDGEGDHIVAGGNHDDGIYIYESTDRGETWEMTFVDETCQSGCSIDRIEYVHPELAFAYGYGNTMIRFTGW